MIVFNDQSHNDLYKSWRINWDAFNKAVRHHFDGKVKEPVRIEISRLRGERSKSSAYHRMRHWTKIKKIWTNRGIRGITPEVMSEIEKYEMMHWIDISAKTVQEFIDFPWRRFSWWFNKESEKNLAVKNIALAIIMKLVTHEMKHAMQFTGKNWIDVCKNHTMIAVNYNVNGFQHEEVKNIFPNPYFHTLIEFDAEMYASENTEKLLELYYHYCENN